MPLQNEVVRETRDGERVFRQWRFRPGQRAHLKVPVTRQTGKIKLPLNAVAIEGPNAFVFREHAHADESGLAAGVGLEFSDAGHMSEEGALEDEHGHHDHEGHLDLEPVPVHILARDHQYVVINPKGELQVGDEVAMNCGHKLLLAMKMAVGGGGGHSHDHEH